MFIPPGPPLGLASGAFCFVSVCLSCLPVGLVHGIGATLVNAALARQSAGFPAKFLATAMRGCPLAFVAVLSKDSPGHLSRATCELCDWFASRAAGFCQNNFSAGRPSGIWLAQVFRAVRSVQSRARCSGPRALFRAVRSVQSRAATGGADSAAGGGSPPLLLA